MGDKKQRKTVCICTNDKSASFLKWALGQYRLPLNIVMCGADANISKFIDQRDMNILIVDPSMMNEPVIPYLQGIRQKHWSLGIILIVPATIKKEEAMQIIREKLVEGMLVHPFSTEVVLNYVDKIYASNRSLFSG